ncbi:mucin-22 [Drosophila tropicalis]|uniref:mucin-22 n=1 Tax=Drosophila tropicalis TaxID=46794 RepID=UPI0035AB81E7
MPRIIALILFLTIAALSTAAPSITTEKPETTTANVTVEDEFNQSSMPTVESETFTIEIDPNVVFTTDPEGLAFTEYTESAIDTTEEPLPESVLQQLERERVELKQEEGGETTIDPRVIATTIRNYVTINRTTSKPLITTTEKLTETTTTVNEEAQVETTTEAIETTTTGKSFKNYFASANVADESIKSEEEERGTEPPLFEDLSALLSENELEEPHHLTENKAQIVDGYQMSNSVWQSPVESTTSEAAGTTTTAPSTSTTEIQPTLPTTIKEEPDTTTIVPDISTTTLANEAEQNLVEASTTRPEEVHIDSTVDSKIFPTTHYPESNIFTTLEPEITTKSSTASYPASFSYTTLTPESTPSPSTTVATTLAPETTSNPISYTTLASETTSNPISYTTTTLAPETTLSTTTTTEAPSTTTSYTTLAPETTSTTTTTTETPISVTEQLLLHNERTTTTPRPIQTRAPRIERIFNSDGVEVLYGYSSVVRTNRLN